MDKETTFPILIAVLFTLFIFLVIFGWEISSYTFAKNSCCNGYRQYVLNNQIGGKCYFVSFMEYTKNHKGCVVERLK